VAALHATEPGTVARPDLSTSLTRFVQTYLAGLLRG